MELFDPVQLKALWLQDMQSLAWGIKRHRSLLMGSPHFSHRPNQHATARLIEPLTSSTFADSVLGAVPAVPTSTSNVSILVELEVEHPEPRPMSLGS